MDPFPSAEQQLLLETTQRFLQHKAPLSNVRSRAESERAYEPAYWTQAAELGWTSVLIPDEFGGVETDEPVIDLTVVAEECGRFVAPGPLLACNVVADALVGVGSPAQRSEYLPGLADGTMTASWAFAEDDCWDADGLELRVQRRDGECVLDGRKTAVEAGDVADLFLVTGRSPDGEICQVLVPRTTPGVSVTPVRGLDLARRFAELTFSDVRLPADAELGEESRAASDVEHQLVLALTVQCAETVGMVDTVFGSALDYMQSRYTFGRPIASYQALKHRIADHKLALEAALAIASGLARAVNERDPEAAELASVAKAHIGEQSLVILSDCAQFFGGIAMTWEHDLHMYLRRATVSHFLYGTPADHRERLCRLVGM